MSFANQFPEECLQSQSWRNAPSKTLEMIIRARGKAVHAGIMPENGKNAIQLLARMFPELEHRIHAFSSALHVTWRTIQGGKATNIVPDGCELSGWLVGPAKIVDDFKLSDCFKDLTEIEVEWGSL